MTELQGAIVCAVLVFLSVQIVVTNFHLGRIADELKRRRENDS